MYRIQLEARLARVRHRFVGSLDSKLNDMIAVFAQASDDAADAADVDGAYRRIHGICGVATTVGFPATGRVALEAEDLLLAAMRDGRRLTRRERALFRQALRALRKAADGELQIMYERRG